MKTLDQILEEHGQPDLKFARAIECSIKINYKVLHKAIEEYVAQFTNWIPVIERLPDKYDRVQILVNKKHNIYPHQYQNGDWYVYDEFKPSIWRESITHWRYFTDLPK